MEEIQIRKYGEKDIPAMVLWLPMSMQDIYMKELDSISWESFREAFC